MPFSVRMLPAKQFLIIILRSNVFIRFNFIISGAFYWGFSHWTATNDFANECSLLPGFPKWGWILLCFFFAFVGCIQLEQRHIFYGMFQMYRWNSVIKRDKYTSRYVSLKWLSWFHAMHWVFVWINCKIMEMLLMRKRKNSTKSGKKSRDKNGKNRENKRKKFDDCRIECKDSLLKSLREESLKHLSCYWQK